MSDASEITRRAKSNLAFALHILPRDRRDDMIVFYAFCRTMDDLADEPGASVEQRERALLSWREGLMHGFENPTQLQKQVIDLRDRRAIPNELFTAIIDGCRMDLEPRRFATWADLDAYIWKVAGAVGLVSIRIFGCVDEHSEKYAIALGRALQLTNILRDVGEDLANGGRIYLPLEDLERFGYTEKNLADHVMSAEFLALMNFEAARAETYYAEAEALLPSRDRKALLPARIMGAIYREVLVRMRRDGFDVFRVRYALSLLRKFSILLRCWIER
ncbi:MAG: phytoene/squalene synthase family protein [Luteolibacter sp.]